MAHQSIFGDTQQQSQFLNRNKAFFELFYRFEQALNAAFDRDALLATQADKAIHFLGKLCVEDFMEIFCLAANGYGIGAMKLVRGLYERAVVASFLSTHPDDAEAFWNWRFVSRYKTIHSYVSAGDPAAGWREKEQEMRATYEAYKDQFEVDDCRKCGTKRTNHNWSKLDFVSIARKTGHLGMLIGQAYHASLNHGHCTSEGLMARLEVRDGRLSFKHDAQPLDADIALQLAHTIVLSLLEVQRDYFKLESLAPIIEQCANDHILIWRNRGLGQDPEKL